MMIVKINYTITPLEVNNRVRMHVDEYEVQGPYSNSGIMTDYAMPPPFNRINNGCTGEGLF
jgi:hypothetical protein